jgi:hypothetical protein
VDVVGHDAIGVKGEIPSGGSFQQITQQPFPGRWIRKARRTALGPNGHEINLATAVVFRGTAEAFLKKRHADRLHPPSGGCLESDFAL